MSLEFLAIAVFITGFWLAIYLLLPLGFWASGDDYAISALAHALNLEWWVETGNHQPDPNLAIHPGVPFYVVSWLCLRAANLASGLDLTNRYQDILATIDTFFLATRLAALIICTASLVWGYYLFRQCTSRLVAVAALLSFFAFLSHAWWLGFLFLGNETFALPLNIALFAVIRREVRTCGRDWRAWAMFGALAAAGYSVKITYIYILIIALALAAISAAGEPRAFREGSRRMWTVLISYWIFILLICVPVMGFNGLRRLIDFHKSLFIHSGYYGSGDNTVFSVNSVIAAAHDIIRWEFLAYGLVAIIFLVVLRLVLIKYRNGDARMLHFGLAALIGICLATLAVLKHYQAYYAIAIVALFPMAVVFILPRRRDIAIVAIVVLATSAAAGSIPGMVRMVETKISHARLADEDLKEILKLPLSSGEFRMWTYTEPARLFLEPFALSNSGVASLIDAYQRSLRTDTSTFDNSKRQCRYIVYNRTWYGTPASVNTLMAGLSAQCRPFTARETLNFGLLQVVETTPAGD